MDRLFLQGLVEELAPAVSGARVRGVALDRASKTLTLSTSLPPPRDLVFSWNRETPGLFRGASRPRGATTPELKRWLVGASIVSLEVSRVDRIATLSLARKRLSGRLEALSLVLELLATRSALYLVEAEAGTVVEVFATGAPRLGHGERYAAPPPPPGAARLAEDAAELSRRLEPFAREGALEAASKSALLAATGGTPLLVREMRSRMESHGESAASVFTALRRELEERRAYLYASEDGSQPPLLSPIRLESEPAREPRPMSSFSEAMREALVLQLAAERRSAGRQRVRSALDRALGKLGRLEAKLESELGALETPEALRARGERLLATLSRARRGREGYVVIPDVFDPEAKEIEVPIDPKRSLVDNAERLFALARRSERARRAIEERLDALSRDRAYWEGIELALEDARGSEELEALAEEATPEAVAARRGPEPGADPAGPRRFVTSNGRTILAGRSGRSNDEVSFRLARPDDLWFHAAGLPGAHVVLKLEPGAEPEERDVEEAAGVAAYFSKARRSSRVEVMVTERRNVSKIKGAPPGTVRLKSHRTLRVPPALPASEKEAKL